MSESLDARAKRIFDLAIDLTGEERVRHVAAESAGDRSLESRVLALLEAAETEDQFLNRPTFNERITVTTERGGRLHTLGAIEEEQPGSLIGQYRIVKLIGEGGFGSVFRAEQTGGVKRDVAIKVIKAGMDTKSVVARFEQERQALALMDHPNIAKVFDAGATRSGRPYFVMELVHGEPITTFCDARSLSIRERLELFCQVCHAVQHAHTKGVIHRDIKPANVLVSEQETPVGEHGGMARCRVIDFGVAKATQQPLTDKTFHTEARQFIGTPEYMSPEQACGSLDIDTRSDVYSLGVVLYELLAGVPPLDASRLRASTLADMQRIIREEDPPAPSTRISTSGDALSEIAARRRTEPRRLGSSIRGELDLIVMRALDKDRSRRYESPGNLAADIQRFLRGEPVEAAPPNVGYRLRKFVTRHRGAAITTGLVGAAMVAGLAGTLWQARVASFERDAAESRRRETEQVVKFQVSQLSGMDIAGVGEQVRGYVLASASDAISRDLLGEPQSVIDARVEDFSRSLAHVNFTDVARRSLNTSIFKASVEAAQRDFAQQPLLRAHLLYTISDTMYRLGMVAGVDEPMQEALDIRTKELGPDHPSTISTISLLAAVKHTQGLYQDAERLNLDAVDRATRVLGPEHETTLMVMNNYAAFLQAESRFTEAESLLRKSIEGLKKLPDSDQYIMMKANANLALVLTALDRNEEAEPHVQAALAWLRAGDGKGEHDGGRNHPDVIRLMQIISNHYESLGLKQEAEQISRESVETAARLFGNDHPSTVRAKLRLAQQLDNKGSATDIREAETIFRELMERNTRLYGPKHPDTLEITANYATCVHRLGRSAEALPYLEQALGEQIKFHGDNTVPVTITRTQIGPVLTALGRFVEAERHLLTVERTMGATHTTGSGIVKRQLAELYEAWDAAEPGSGYGAKAQEYRSQLDD